MRKETRISGRAAFTILEMATVVVILMILLLMITQITAGVKEKARRSLCQNNLRNLFSAASNYLNDQNGVWPQIPTDNIQSPAYAQAWVAAFRPYGLAPVNWICPSVQYVLHNINYEAYPRVDYLGTPFGDTPRDAFKYSTQPWFIERGDIHGDGNLLIFASGQVKSMREFMESAQTPPN